MEERDRMDTLVSVRDSQLSFSADTESESNGSSTCCSSSSSTKSLIAYSINIHTYFNGSCMRKFQKEKNYYKNNRGSFWELENRIMGRKKRIMCGCLSRAAGSAPAGSRGRTRSRDTIICRVSTVCCVPLPVDSLSALALAFAYFRQFFFLLKRTEGSFTSTETASAPQHLFGLECIELYTTMLSPGAGKRAG